MYNFSLFGIFKRFKSKIIFTWSLVLIEAIVFLLYPLFIGFAIDDLINKNTDGLIFFAGLALFHLVFASARRFYDTRIYSKIYLKIAPELTEKEFEKKSEASKVSARTNMLNELVEFLENQFPEIVNTVITLVGTLGILFLVNFNVFLGSMITIIITLIVYGLSSDKIFRLNSGFNDELEKHFDVIKSRNKLSIFNHFDILTKFNIKLSDLETINFAAIWISFIGLLVYSIYTIVYTQENSYGDTFSSIMYVFNFIETMIMLPYFYQQYVRLKEITDRISS